MDKIKKIICALLFAILLSGMLSGCEKSDHERRDKSPKYTSFRDIPGVTEDEIKAIEALQEQKLKFVYGMPLSTEAFPGEDKKINGFTALFCNWLTELFEIPFTPAYYEFLDLLAALKSGEVDFSGELTETAERNKIYFMTDDIAARALKYYRLKDSKPLSKIAATRPLRYGFIEKSNTPNVVASVVDSGTYEVVFIRSMNQVHQALKSEKIDAFLYSGTADANFDHYSDIVSDFFLPLVYSSVSLATQNPKLAPIISVMQKALRSDAIYYLNDLYKQGYQEYKRHKLFMRLSKKELSYIKTNPVIPFVADYDNYPINFYNTREKKWQGIAFDVLREVEALTGLEFKIINDRHAEFPELLQMLENGDALLIAELVHTPGRQGRFIWPNSSFFTDQAVLISRTEHPNISVNEVLSEKVGLNKGTVNTELFHRWFPKHNQTVEYETQSESFKALRNGDIDMVMNSYSSLLHLTNYLELPGFKANIMFDNNFESTFGFYKEADVLCSIVDKALELIDTDAISGQWLRKTYDYRSKLAEGQRPWIIGAVSLFLFVLILLTILFLKNRNEGKKLERLVKLQTKELALQTSTLQLIINSIPDLIFCRDSDLKFTLCNTAALSHYGLDNSIIGKTLDEIQRSLKIPEEIITRTYEADRIAIEEGRTDTEEIMIPSSDGKKRYFDAMMAPLIQDDGATVGLICINRDITERKEKEESAVALSNTLAKITKSPAISAGILKDAADLIAQEGCCALNCNRVTVWTTTDGAGTLNNVSTYDISTGEHYVQGDFCLSTREEYTSLLKSERLIVTNDIRQSAVLSDLTDEYAPNMVAVLDIPIRIDGKLAGVVCVEQDRCEAFPEKREWTIEEQNFASSLADLAALAISGAERRIARDAAEMANRAKSAFLANMSHEMRTPMNVVVGLTELMLEEDDALTVNIKENLKKISTAGNTLMGLINDVLDISKIEAGKLELMPVKYDVPSLLSDIITLNIIRIDEKPITFHLDINEDLLCCLYGDDLRVKQIINNLLSNAFKYTQKGTVTLGMNCERKDDDVWMSIYVSDTGIGIREEDLEKLFTDYSQVDTRTHRRIEGTGLGLSITKMLVEHMNGEISVESEYGKCTVFRLRIRQGFVSDKNIGAELAENLRSFSYSDNRKRAYEKLVRPDLSYAGVLVVDDMQTNLDVAAGMLKKYKMRVDCVSSGQEAIDRINEGEPVYDAIFMDHMMPGMDGVEATEKIRSLGTKYAMTIPIIALTANAIAGNEQMFLNNDFQAFLAKPINIMNLDSIVQRWVRDKARE